MNLRMWIKQTGTTQTELSKRSGVPIATIHRVLNGQQASAPVALKLWEATDCEVHLLSILYPNERFTLALEKEVQSEEQKQVDKSPTVVVSDHPHDQSERS